MKYGLESLCPQKWDSVVETSLAECTEKFPAVTLHCSEDAEDSRVAVVYTVGSTN